MIKCLLVLVATIKYMSTVREKQTTKTELRPGDKFDVVRDVR